MKIAVVVPCYNVSKHIEEVVQGLPEFITWIIAVNDCSKDNTDAILLRLAERNKKIVYLKHKINQGVGAAMITGYKKSLELNADLIISNHSSKTKQTLQKPIDSEILKH